MYNFDHQVTHYETDDDYQREFLSIFNTNDIMSDDVTHVLDEIYSLVKDNSDWSELLCLLANTYCPALMLNQEMALTIAFSFTHMEHIHKCLQEFKEKNTTDLVKNLIKKIQE